jgi:hypothetical protein
MSVLVGYQGQSGNLMLTLGLSGFERSRPNRLGGLSQSAWRDVKSRFTTLTDPHECDILRIVGAISEGGDRLRRRECICDPRRLGCSRRAARMD